jgi:hypothetical protein
MADHLAQEKGRGSWRCAASNFNRSISIDSENVVDLLAYRNVFAGAVSTKKEVCDGTIHVPSSR